MTTQEASGANGAKGKARRAKEDLYRQLILDAAESVFALKALQKGAVVDMGQQKNVVVEKSVMEMHQMFVDLALIVESQGELLDCIEYQVKQTIEFVDEGNENLVQAIQIQKNILRRKCYCLIAVLLLTGIIVLIVKLKASAASSATGGSR
jgi:t-SNARE complex subunit (syntaxin)